jgi:hypothetical protein
MATRRESLHAYLLEVTRDLIGRGMLRKGSGQTLEAILKAEMNTVVQSALDDLREVGKDMVAGLITGALSGLFKRR